MLTRTCGTGLLRLTILLPLLLAAGCSDDDDPTGPPPAPPEPTHYEVEVSMHSISVGENCEDEDNNPGDFIYTLEVITYDENQARIPLGGIGPDEVGVHDRSTVIIPEDPVRFTMPNDPDAAFRVSYRIGEEDPSGFDFQNVGTYLHILDATESQLWATEDRGFAVYHIDESENGVGEFYFDDWYTTRCWGNAYYLVRWKPIYEDDQDNGKP